MKLFPILGHCAFSTLLVLSISCADSATPPAAPAPDAPSPDASASTVDEGSSLDVWWDHLSALCGNAYAGALTSTDATDADLTEASMTMHVRRCEERRLEIPFHIGENRSRTWVLTRTEDGLQLQHDHRHEDGSEDTVTLYGGHTEAPGTEVAQHFPADEYSKTLFEANELAASVANVWSMEVVPGERFSYILRRPGRHFQADFDLTQSVDPPPAPWGYE